LSRIAFYHYPSDLRHSQQNIKVGPDLLILM
jgi:hypothetical protein